MEQEELIVALGSLCSIESPIFEKDYGWDRESLPPAVVRTVVRPGHFARILGGQSVAKTSALKSSRRVDGRHLTPWCISGQGWSLVGIPRGNDQHSHFFISWEGATAAFGAYVQRLHGAELATLSDRHVLPSISVFCDVLPTDVFVTMGKNQRAHNSGKAKKTIAAASPVRLPFTSSSLFTKPFMLPDRLQKLEKRKSEGHNVGYTDFGMHRSDSFHEDEEEPSGDAGFDDIVTTALDSITSMIPFHEHHDPRNAIAHPMVGSAGPGASHRAKSALLLRHCSSWTQLDDNEENRALIDGQVIVACFRLGPSMQHYRSLTLRKNVITNGIATPFHQVLSWLCQRKDYFTAASVALNLLNDLEALRDLRGSPAGSSEGSHDERSYLEGLLDGIIPLEGSDFAACASSITDNKSNPGLLVENMTLLHRHSKEKSTQTPSTVTSLADMAVGCLIRGGAGMSQTLEGFLGRNTYYDASRACLMLAATTANAISDQHEMKALSEPRKQSDESVFKCESPMENILWPIRCLLRIAVTRDCMPTALLLLSATIPNEIRCRESRGSFGLEVDTCRPSLDLCISVVTMIVASSSSAAGYLLSLSDEQSHLSYWQSLDRDTQLSLSMISIQGKYPLLREAEVRAWALEEISSSVETMSMPRDEEPVLSSGWLKELCTACLSNAGCAFGHLSSLRSIPYGSEEDCEDGIGCRKEEMKFIRDALSPSPGTGGLDFDLLLPSLLLLQHRGVSWRDGVSVSTQSLLNMVCDLAGRQTLEEPSFAFDGVAVMKQCATAENILAAAYLIGGQDGFILHCADVLIKSLGLSMKQAESLLLKKGLLMRDTDRGISKVDSKEAMSPSFELSDGHRYLLWLLEEHVFNVKTFGQFDTSGVRGGIDPVFAARTCLRAWLCLMQSGNEGCRLWLVSWIRKKLGVTVKGTVSMQRLACAALCRALLWPDDGDLVDWNDGKGGTRCSVLAEDLGFPCDFLVELAQACCGLIEAIPAPIAEEVLSGGQDSDEVGLTGRTIQV
uniref:Uncharacterized protein n=1 Tax=Odontella aurita TaxID=265563 RepID=A0A7S4HS27_9STRA